MHLSRRLRLIWHKLWLIPLVGATADVVASEAAKLGGVTVPIPWLFSAIGVAGMLGAAVVRAYSVPLIPEGLETPDEALTRRSRVLGERLGATPVRVFVSDLPKLRGKVDTFIDGHDLFVSVRVAELQEAQRDFVLARALATLSPEALFHQGHLRRLTNLGWLIMTLVSSAAFIDTKGRGDGPLLGVASILMIVFITYGIWLVSRPFQYKDYGWGILALKVTGDLDFAIDGLHALADTDAQHDDARREANAIAAWWRDTGQKAVEASEWYQRERSLAAKAE